ncbi:MAG: Na+/H+ antiporter subunit E, partial [Rhizobiales bacterium]|nr:Na+/H+ antiporter subunit E [Hyphomicrobiales bacterium]
LEQPKARPRRPLAILRLAFIVSADIVKSNIAVACIIIGFGRRERRPGFVAKFALLTAALNSQPDSIPIAAWIFLVILILSGLATLIATTRAGIHALWASPDRAVPSVRLVEIVPIVALILLCAAQTMQAGPVMRYAQAAAGSLYTPHDYLRSVLGTENVLQHIRREPR